MAKNPTNQRGSNAGATAAATRDRQAKIQQAAGATRTGPSPVVIAGIVAISVIFNIINVHRS